MMAFPDRYWLTLIYALVYFGIPLWMLWGPHGLLWM